MRLMIYTWYIHFRYIHSLDHFEAYKIREIINNCQKKKFNVRLMLHFNNRKSTPNLNLSLHYWRQHNFGRVDHFPLKSCANLYLFCLSWQYPLRIYYVHTLCLYKKTMKPCIFLQEMTANNSIYPKATDSSCTPQL